MIDVSVLNPGNATYLDTLYQDYLEHPESVSIEWRDYFKSVENSSPIARSAAVAAPTSALHTEKQVAVLQMINAYRFRGHRQADLDPLRLYERPGVPDLEPAYHGLGEEDMDTTFNVGSLVGKKEQTLREVLDVLRETYCKTIGAEYMYITSTLQKRWIQERLETARGQPNFSKEKKLDILRWTTAARKLEDYLHKKYVGQKRFSLEGGENLIPLIDEIIQRSGATTTKEVIIGMAHRGRLNVLVNILGKHPKILFGEFEGTIDEGTGSGDVKYHKGFSSEVETPGGAVHLVLAFNPSHLEIINPVVEGSVRARQERRRDQEANQVIPVQIHGDAAFAGQGVVMETLNLAETRGYGTGGTIHVVVNNQIGFTTSDPLDSRSTLYCTDVAKMVQAPILHVNGNDAEAVVFVTQLAVDYRMQFKKDIVIDLVCFRRYGHNESDEPFATQPMMYKKIKHQKGPRREYADQLVAEGLINDADHQKLSDDYLSALEGDREVSRPIRTDHQMEFMVHWDPYVDSKWTDAADTRLDTQSIQELGNKLTECPDDFELHRSVQRIVDARRAMATGDRPMDWGFAESLAYAALLKDGYAVRISGQDSERGTFFHRHAVMHNQKQRGTYTPLRHLFEGQPRFRIINSMLSEEAVLAFEYGYSTAEPECLVVWEAQFGDFVNTAQVVIDQFLSSSEAKWGRYCGLVMLLPHGYDGQGPEHSSARLERYLQLCAEDNMQVCVPSTPAQIFHLLRRQMIRPLRTPLIIMSPKSLLRHKLATSTREDLSDGAFQVLIDEIDDIDPKKVTRLVMCCGKVYYDILERRRELGLDHIAIVRVEQLYPFPKVQIEVALKKYAKADEICWTQEEPRNQGIWFHMLSRRHLAGCVQKRHKLSYSGRTYSASPASGFLNVHLEQQRTLVDGALGLHEVKESKRTA
jgi:2-oxoglutarate dehydrogenase E1 component